MRSCHFLILLALLLCLTGCRNNPRVAREIEQMGSQRRALEDQVYDLQYEFDKQADEVKRLKTENTRLKSQLEAATLSPTVPEMDDGGPALIDLSAGNQNMRIEPVRPERILPVSQASFSDKPRPSSTDVQNLEINKLRSVLRDADGNGLIDTVVLHLTPRNAAGEFITHADYVDVVIRERSAAGPLVGQWKIAKREMDRILSNSMYKKTVPLELDLTSQFDLATEFFLDVRYGTSGVRKSGVLTSRGISTSRSEWSPFR